MKQTIAWILYVCGILFIIEVVGLAYLFIADPLGLKPLLFGGAQPVAAEPAPSRAAAGTAAKSGPTPVQLSPAQKSALQALGVDPAAIPATITATQQACLVAKLGAARVGEIEAGGLPTGNELLAAKACF